MGVPRILQRPEVIPEAVEAWRAWAVVEIDGEPRLSSLTRPERWTPGEAVTAICRHPTHLRPRRFCSCGVYAVPRPGLLAGLGSIAGGAVGQVSLWGRVVEHEHGLRAQSAYPARLRLVCVACLAEGAGRTATVVAREHRAPGVDVLRPLCDAHAGASGERDLRDARPVEAALRAAYAVDLLPEEALARIGEGLTEIAAARAERRRRLAFTRLGGFALVLAMLVPALRGLGDVDGDLASAPVTPVDQSANPFTGARTEPEESVLGNYPQDRRTVDYPQELGVARCARIRADHVSESFCVEGQFNAYAWAVAPLRKGPGGCPGGTVEATRDDDLGLLLCWRLLEHRG